ncbi:MAG: molecular chaperone HtpG, partial [Exilispira sp.]
TFHDWVSPIDIIHTKAEGIIEYVALLFIPSKAPLDLMSAEYEKGLKLYSKNIFIMDKCKELIPDHYRFVKGLIDSPDFSLNISREILQHDRQLRIIAKNIEKKITESLINLQKDKRDEYEKWWKEFGTIIKSGIYSDFLKEKNYLLDLLIFETSLDKIKMTTLDEYISRMKPEQKEIYYISGPDRKILENHPQIKKILEKGYEVLFLTDKIDEFMMINIPDYKGKPLKSLNRVEKDLEKSDNLKIKENELKPLLEMIEKNLTGKISKVILSSDLKDSLSCILTTDKGLSIQMEKVLSELEGNSFPKAEKILQINPEHPLFKKLEASYKVDQNSPKISQYSQLFYNEALLLEGILPENPSNFIEIINNLMEK